MTESPCNKVIAALGEWGCGRRVSELSRARMVPRSAALSRKGEDPGAIPSFLVSPISILSKKKFF